MNDETEARRDAVAGQVERPVRPLRHEDGTLVQKMLTVGGRPFRCQCGCNVFHHPNELRGDLYECNSCHMRLEAE